MYPDQIIYDDLRDNPRAADNSILEDRKIGIAITDIVESYCNRKLLQRTFTCVWNNPKKTLLIPTWPIENPEQLRPADTEDTLYAVDFSEPNILKLMTNVFRRLSLKVTAGYSLDNLPSDIYNAANLISASNRAARIIPTDTDHNAADYSITKAKVDVHDFQYENPRSVIPYAAMALLDKHKRITI